MSDKPNQLGWVTSLQLMPKMYDVTSYSDNSPQYISTGSVEFNLSGFVSSTPGAMEVLQSWLSGGIRAPQLLREWRCLYCTSPNDINRTHCRSCGAPRNFILG